MADTERSGDVVWAVIAAVLFGVPTVIVGSVTTGWADATGWMLDRDVLVPSAANPVLTLPAADGAGLDWTRIGIVLGALMVVSLAIRIIAGLIVTSVARRTAVDPRRRRPRQRRRLS